MTATADDALLASLLTPEELAAIQQEPSPEERAIMRSGGDDDVDGVASAPVATPPAQEGKPAVAEAADAAPSGSPVVPAAPVAQQDEAAAPTAAPVPAPAATAVDVPAPRPFDVSLPLPPDYDSRVQAVKAKEAELRQKYKSGEIDLDARDAGLAELDEQKQELLVVRTKFETARDMNQRRIVHDVEVSLAGVLKQAVADGVDYRDPKNSSAFDRYSKFLAEDPDWAGRSISEVHAEAHRYVLGRLGKAPAVAAPASTQAATPAAQAPVRKPSLEGLPKTIAQVPGSDGPGDVAGEFADIEQLDGLELEDAIAKMTPAQRAKFVQGR